MIERLAYSHEC